MIPSPLSDHLGTGILHLGLGAFHRAHQAAFTQDAIAARGGAWGIEAVSMRNPVLAETLSAQDGRFTLIEQHSDGPVLRDMSVIRRATALPGNTDQVIERFADPGLHIVTITVTEKGYGADIGARALNQSDAAVAHDLSRPNTPPQSLPGLLVHGLKTRRNAGLGGLTLMSCDNLTDNGRLLIALLTEMAEAHGADLARWIEDACRCPNAMVDRITPAATPETFAIAKDARGWDDKAAIETEPFRQWVIEDRFAGPRPAWDAAGAQIVPDVAPFEAMKLRLLNGAHSMIAYLGALAGLSAVRDVMAEPVLRDVVRRHMAFAAETLSPAEGLNPDAYADALISRFENRAIDHRCLQIATDGSQKMPQRIFAAAQEQALAGRDIGTFALAIAAWIKFCGETDQSDLPLNDPLAGQIRSALDGAGSGAADRIAATAGIVELAGREVLTLPQVATATALALERLDANGPLAAAQATLGDHR